MARYLAPKNEFIFRNVFGKRANMCISFLNNMLPLEGEQKIVSVEYLPVERMPEIPEDRNRMVVVQCTDGTGRRFLVEIQMFRTGMFVSRMTFDGSKASVIQMKGREYKFSQPVYVLGLFHEAFDHSTSDYYHHYTTVNLRGTETRIGGFEYGKRFHSEFVPAPTDTRIDGLELVFVELSKFKPGNSGDKKLHELWIRFLTEIYSEMRKPPADLMLEPDIKEAIGYIEEGEYSDAELLTYERFLDGIRTERSIWHDIMEKSDKMGRTERKAKMEEHKDKMEAIEVEHKAKMEAIKVEHKAKMEVLEAEHKALEAELAEYKRLKSE